MKLKKHFLVDFLWDARFKVIYFLILKFPSLFESLFFSTLEYCIYYCWHTGSLSINAISGHRYGRISLISGPRICSILTISGPTIDCFIAKLSQNSTSTVRGWSLVLFLNFLTTPPTRNSKIYAFQEAEIWHASYIGSY